MNQVMVTHRELLRAALALNCDRVSAEVVGAMQDAGIQTILLKGPSIARWLYPSGGRSYGDTDLLVPARDIARATEVLRSLGFSDLLDGFHPLERDAQSAETTFARRAVSGRGPDGLVDLHHNLPMLPASDEDVWQTLSAGTETLRIGGVEARVLGRAALALHVVLHAVQHGFDGHTREDLSRAVAAMPADGWREAADLAGRLGVADVLGSGLRHQAGGAGIADRLGLPGGPVAESRHWQRFAPRGAAALTEFGAAATLREKTQRIRWILLPSPAKVRYVSRRPGARGGSLLLGYARWWHRLALAIVPAMRYARARKRLAGSRGARR